MRFLIDNALSSGIAEGLRSAGHDAVHVRDVGMGAASDPELFAVAQAEKRTIVSADTDFGVLLATTQQTTPSFVLVRRSDKRPAASLEVLVANLDRLKDDIEAGCVAVIEDGRIRVRKLPM